MAKKEIVEKTNKNERVNCQVFAPNGQYVILHFGGKEYNFRHGEKVTIIREFAESFSSIFLILQVAKNAPKETKPIQEQVDNGKELLQENKDNKEDKPKDTKPVKENKPKDTKPVKEDKPKK